MPNQPIQGNSAALSLLLWFGSAGLGRSAGATTGEILEFRCALR